MLKRLTTTLFLLLLALSLTGLVFAQEEIEIGDSVDGEADDDTVEYEIELDEGDEIAITLESDDFDTIVRILDEDEDELDSNDDGDGMGLNSYLEFEAEDDGTYIIVVDAFGGDPDGDFELSVEALDGKGSNDDDDDDDDSSSVDYDGDWGRDVECRDGDDIEGGVELTIVQQRSGNQYRVTAIGIDGFDPVLAVMLTGDYNDALCNDNDSEAATYSADLPTTGDVDDSNDSAQVIFNLNSANAFENVSIVVAGEGESSGEFVLIIEGMYASSADGAGDPMSLALTPSLIESGVDPTAYMISVVSAFDPLIYLADNELNQLSDDDGNPLACDDAGNSGLCWGESESLSGSYVSRSQNRELGGGQYDSMITIPVSDDLLGFYLNYVMTSYGSTEGDYVVAFHMGVEAED